MRLCFATKYHKHCWALLHCIINYFLIKEYFPYTQKSTWGPTSLSQVNVTEGYSQVIPYLIQYLASLYNVTPTVSSG